MEGPRLEEIHIKKQVCNGCDHHQQELFKSGREPVYWHYCNHARANDELMLRGGRRRIGESSDTPEWCPVNL